MLVSESSAMHQLRRRSAQKPQLDLIADRMPLEHCVIRPVRSKAGSTSGGRKVLERWSARVVETKAVQIDLATGSRGDHQAAFATTQPCHQHTGSPVGAKRSIAAWHF